MDTAFKLNNQQGFVSIEIRDIASQRVLAAEFGAVQFPVAQACPQHYLRPS